MKQISRSVTKFMREFRTILALWVGVIAFSVMFSSCTIYTNGTRIKDNSNDRPTSCKDVRTTYVGYK